MCAEIILQWRFNNEPLVFYMIPYHTIARRVAHRPGKKVTLTAGDSFGSGWWARCSDAGSRCRGWSCSPAAASIRRPEPGQCTARLETPPSTAPSASACGQPEKAARQPSHPKPVNNPRKLCVKRSATTGAWIFPARPGAPRAMAMGGSRGVARRQRQRPLT